MPISAVCFDVGGVLIRISYRWCDVATRLGVALPSHVPQEALLTDCDFFNRYQSGALTDGAYLAELARYLDVDVPTATKVHNGILVEPFPGVEDLVRDLNQGGILTGCLSNTNEPHWVAMRSSGRFPANEQIELSLASHRVGLQKPSEGIFREFERQSGRRPDEIVLFDDTTQNCVAARSFGWHAVAVDPHGDPAHQMRDVLSGFGVLPAAIIRNKV